MTSGVKAPKKLVDRLGSKTLCVCVCVCVCVYACLTQEW